MQSNPQNLQLVFGAILLGGLLTDPRVRAMAEQGGGGGSSGGQSEDRITGTIRRGHIALNLGLHMMDAARKLREARSLDERRHYTSIRNAAKNDFNAAADDLFFYMLDQYTGCPTVEMVSEMFKTKLDTFDSFDPSYMERVEELVPIAVARELIAKHRIPFDIYKMKGFDPFAMKYRKVIMG